MQELVFPVRNTHPPDDKTNPMSADPSANMKFLHVLAIFCGARSHPKFSQNNGAKGSRTVVQKIAHPPFDRDIAAATKKRNPTGRVDQRHSGVSRTRSESSCAEVIKVGESPNLSAKSRMRPRRARSPKAVSTATLLVLAPETRMPSSRRLLGISKVVFIQIQ